MYEWIIVFRNDTMGFQKTYKINADSWLFAGKYANNSLRDAGYDPGDFAIISLIRSRAVGS